MSSQKNNFTNMSCFVLAARSEISQENFDAQSDELVEVNSSNTV